MTEATLDTTTVRRWNSYPSYRSFQSETVSRLPDHWRPSRLKHATRLNPEVLTDATDPDYEIEYIDIGNVDATGRINELQAMRFENAPSRARRIVRHGDVLISTVRTYLRAIAAIENPPENLIASTGFAVLRANGECHPRFLSRLVQSNEFVDMVVNHSEGVGYPAINPTELATLPIWLPPLAEQRAIAAFLDRETARIDALIGHKERLIALLEEKRQAVISHAVTRGLDPNAKMKATNNSWISEVPSHWIVGRLGFLASKVGDGLHGTPQYTDGSEVRFINGNNLQNGRIVDTSTTRTVDEEEFEKHKVHLDESSLLLSINGTIGSAAYYRGERIILSKSAAFINCGPDLSRDFLYFFVQASPVLNAFKRDAGGTTIPNLSLESIRKTWIALPPRDEQERIAQSLASFSCNMDSARTTIERSIEQLQEYRTAIISAAVTGQIDVRDEVPEL